MKNFAAFMTFLSLVVLSSCTLESSDTDGSQPYAAVSVYALSPDAPYLNVFLNQNTIAANVPFGSYTLYNQVLAGTTTINAQVAGGASTIVNTSFPTSEGKYYSVFLVDSFSSVKAVTISDNLQPVTGDSIRIRFFNFSPDAPAVDMVSSTDSSNKKVMWANRSFTDSANSDSINNFIYASTGSYTFSVVKSNSTDTLATFARTDLTKAGNYTLFLKGFYTNSTGDTTISLGIRPH